MAYININTDYPIYDGMQITFKAPCDCTQTEGLRVNSKNFVFKDAHGVSLTGIGNLFSKGAYVKVILDAVNGYAYMQNADTNSYLEGKSSPAGSNAPHDGGYNLTITANHIFYVANNDCGLVITCDVSALPDGYVGFVHLYGVGNMQGVVSGDINTTSVNGKSISVLHGNQYTYLVVMKPRGGTKLDWCCFNSLSGGGTAPVYNGEVEVE